MTKRQLIKLLLKLKVKKTKMDLKKLLNSLMSTQTSLIQGSGFLMIVSLSSMQEVELVT